MHRLLTCVEAALLLTLAGVAIAQPATEAPLAKQQGAVDPQLFGEWVVDWSQSYGNEALFKAVGIPFVARAIVIGRPIRRNIQPDGEALAMTFNLAIGTVSLRVEPDGVSRADNNRMGDHLLTAEVYDSVLHLRREYEGKTLNEQWRVDSGTLYLKSEYVGASGTVKAMQVYERAAH